MKHLNQKRQTTARSLMLAVIGLLIGLPIAAFDGNAFPDLVIGVPGEDYNDVQDAGVVNVLYGTAAGLTTTGNRYFSQDDAGMEESCELRDYFGRVIVSGDFNADGFADIAVGIEEESDGDVSVAGAVQILYGSSSGLTSGPPANQVFTQNSPGVPDDSEQSDAFGSALAVGDFNSDGYSDLAIGAPNEEVDPTEDTGAVTILFGGSEGLSSVGSQFWTQATGSIGGVMHSEDYFGESLAAGDINGDGFDDLCVGVPGDRISGELGGGCVNILYGSASGLTDAGNEWLWQSGAVMGVGQSYAEFGEQIVIGDFNGDSFADIGIAAPGYDRNEDLDCGFVVLVSGTPFGVSAGSAIGFTHTVSTAYFGSGMTSGDITGDGFDDLIVGAPGQAVNSVSKAGCIFFIPGSPQSVSGQTWTMYYQGDGIIPDLAESKDLMGYHLVCSDFDGDSYEDLAIGVPSEDFETPEEILGVGAVFVIRGSASGLIAQGAQTWHQDTPDVAGVAEEHDGFGVSLTVAYAPSSPNACSNTGVTLWMPSHSFSPESPCGCVAMVCNAESSAIANPLFVILEVAGAYYFAPSFGPYDHYLDEYPTFPPGRTQVTVLPEFIWPQGVGSFSGCTFYGALTDTAVTSIIGTFSSWEFSWNE